jgi:hypothetical protein
LNDFPAGRTAATPILFGLRGCRISRSAQSLEDEVELVDARPNHRSIGCVMGVWDRANGRIGAFPASTAPMESVILQYLNGGDVGNILPTGFYGYVVGEQCTSVCRPGCFLLRTDPDNKRTVVVRRSRNNAWYDLKDEYDVCKPGDNIHPLSGRRRLI